VVSTSCNRAPYSQQRKRSGSKRSFESVDGWEVPKKVGTYKPAVTKTNHYHNTNFYTPLETLNDRDVVYPNEPSYYESKTPFRKRRRVS
jgi:hypothetical protein